jgi:hypothetical protein
VLRLPSIFVFGLGRVTGGLARLSPPRRVPREWWYGLVVISRRFHVFQHVFVFLSHGVSRVNGTAVGMRASQRGATLVKH